MIQVTVIRKIKSYTLGVGGIGTVDWEILLECGHREVRNAESLTKTGFLSELECTDCEKMAKQDLEKFRVGFRK